MPLISDDNIRYNLVSQTDYYFETFNESLLWQVTMRNTVPYLTFNGMDMPLTLVYDSTAPYFFASTMMDVTGAPVADYDMSKLMLYSLSERTIEIHKEARVYPVFNYNTINFNYYHKDLMLAEYGYDLDWMEQKIKEDSTYAEIPYIDGEENEMLSDSARATVSLHLLEGFSVMFLVKPLNPDMYRVHWQSDDPLYNDVYSNRLLVTPLHDIDLTFKVEEYSPVIVIAGDTITLNPDSSLVINVTNDGSITLDLTTNTITLDSAAVTGTGISSELQDFTLAVENNSTIAVDEEYGIKFDGESLTLQTGDSVMLTVQAPQPLVGNGGSLYIDGNFIFSSVEFRLTAGQAAARRSNIRRMPADANPLMRPAVSGFANVELADGIEVREVYYADEDGNVVPGDPTKTHYHAAEAAYGEVDVDTQSFTPATSLVFADSNFYTDYIDGKIEIVSGLEKTTADDTVEVRKIIDNGTVLILRAGTAYTVLGTVAR